MGYNGNYKLKILTKLMEVYLCLFVVEVILFVEG